MPQERKKVGEVFHFYGKIGVAAIRLTDDGIAIGDTVQIQGPATNLEQTVETLQIEHAERDVERAREWLAKRQTPPIYRAHRDGRLLAEEIA